MQTRSRLLAMLSATLMAAWGAGLTGCDQDSDTTAVDPRAQGLMPHPLAEPDPSILAAKGSARSTPTPRPTPTPTPTPGTAAGTSTGPRPETGPEPSTATAPETGPATADATFPYAVVPDDHTAYPIKLTRPDVVGATVNMRVSVDNTSTQKTTPTNGAAKEEKKAAKGELTGKMTIASIDAQGLAKDFTFTVTSFTSNGKDLIPSGKIVDIKRVDIDVMFSIAGETLSDEAKNVLRAMFVPVEYYKADDEIMGSSTPQKVGDTWHINRETEAKTYNVDVQNVGDLSVALLSVVDTPAGKALRVEGAWTVKDYKPKSLAGNATVENSLQKSQIAGIYPVDTALPALEVLQRHEFDLRYTLPTETREIHTQVNKRETITPENVALPPAAPTTFASAVRQPSVPTTTPETAVATRAALPEAVQSLIKQAITLLEAAKYAEAVDVMAGPAVSKRLHDDNSFDKVVEETKSRAPAMIKALKAAPTATPTSVSQQAITFAAAEPDGLPLHFQFIEGNWSIK